MLENISTRVTADCESGQMPRIIVDLDPTHVQEPLETQSIAQYIIDLSIDDIREEWVSSWTTVKSKL